MFKIVNFPLACLFWRKIVPWVDLDLGEETSGNGLKKETLLVTYNVFFIVPPFSLSSDLLFENFTWYNYFDLWFTFWWQEQRISSLNSIMLFIVCMIYH